MSHVVGVLKANRILNLKKKKTNEFNENKMVNFFMSYHI